MATKKELKQIYKEMKFKIGVFQLKNKVNNKIYIESSADLVAIWNRLKFQLNGGLHPNQELQKDWKEFGEANFSYEILAEVKQDETHTTDYYRKEAKEMEQLFIEELQPFGDKGYNKKKQPN